MMQELDQALSLAATRTFEELCCVWAEPWPADEAEPELAHGAAVAFEGPRAGWLELYVSARTLPPLTATMLGDDEAPELMQIDALGELANVICGNLLPAVAGADAVFRLGSPGPVPKTTSEPTALVRLQLDFGAAELRLHLA